MATRLRRRVWCLILVLAVLSAAAQPPQPPEKLLDVSARLTDPDAQGRQELKLTLKIKDGWHLYANPAGVEDYVPTTLAIQAQPVPRELKITYPEGKAMEDPAGNGTLRVYEGEVTLRATWLRPGAAKGAEVEVSLRYQACDAATCLPPKTLKLKVRGR